MKKLAVTFLGFVALLASASALNLPMTYVASSSAVYNGKPAYADTVAGGFNSQLLNMTDFKSASPGETWVARVGPVINLGDKRIAWLFLQELATSGSDPDIQGAVWRIYDNTVPLTPGAAAWYALALSQTFTPHEFDHVVKYDAIFGTQSGSLGTAPDYLGVTPEPSTLLLLGSGLVSVFFRWKRA